MIALERDRFAHLLAQGAELGPYDEMPLIPAQIDPQLFLSRNDRLQPFFLICERDTLLATLTGSGRVEFRGPTVQRIDIVPGDHVYVPSRTPHRILPDEPMIQVRYKANPAGLEAVAWYCTSCGGEVWRSEFDTADQIPQAAWWEAVTVFNADHERRACAACGTVAPAVDLEGLRWPEVAAAIGAEADDT